MPCEPGCSCCAPGDLAVILVVTINPEGRVEATRTDIAFPPMHPGAWTDLDVAIINQGFVTGPLDLQWSGQRDIEVDTPSIELTGAPRQDMRFRIRLNRSGAADIKLRFWALGSLGGLANKSTVQLYCRTSHQAVIQVGAADQQTVDENADLNADMT